MTQPPTQTSPPDEDQDWFDQLAGRTSARPNLEGRALRAALLRHRAQAPAGEMPDPVTRIERLLTRARAEGVLPPLRADQSVQQGDGTLGRSKGRPLMFGAALALLAGFAWFATQDRQSTGLPVEWVLRGDGVQQRQSQLPAQARDILLRDLRAAGIDAAPYQQLDREGLDASLAQPLSKRHRQALLRAGLQVPEGPVLRVEFIPIAP